MFSRFTSKAKQGWTQGPVPGPQNLLFHMRSHLSFRTPLPLAFTKSSPHGPTKYDMIFCFPLTLPHIDPTLCPFHIIQICIIFFVGLNGICSFMKIWISSCAKVGFLKIFLYSFTNMVVYDRFELSTFVKIVPSKTHQQIQLFPPLPCREKTMRQNKGIFDMLSLGEEP